MKSYLTPLSILVGSVIISVSLYLAITSEQRAQFNWCVESYTRTMPEAPLKETKDLCRALQNHGN